MLTHRETRLWLSLGGFQEQALDAALPPENLEHPQTGPRQRIRNTHVVVDDTGVLREKYRYVWLVW